MGDDPQLLDSRWNLGCLKHAHGVGRPAGKTEQNREQARCVLDFGRGIHRLHARRFGLGLDPQHFVLASIACGRPASDHLRDALEIRQACLGDAQLLLAREQRREGLTDRHPPVGEQLRHTGFLGVHVQIGFREAGLPLMEQEQRLLRDDLVLRHGTSAEAGDEMNAAVVERRIWPGAGGHSIGCCDTDRRALRSRSRAPLVEQLHHVGERHLAWKGTRSRLAGRRRCHQTRCGEHGREPRHPSAPDPETDHSSSSAARSSFGARTL